MIFLGYFKKSVPLAVVVPEPVKEVTDREADYHNSNQWGR